jgi:hypothetical protein
MKASNNDTEKLTQEFLKNNPALKQTLETFRVSQQQYAQALKASNSPEIRSSDSIAIQLDASSQ